MHTSANLIIPMNAPYLGIAPSISLDKFYPQFLRYGKWITPLNCQLGLDSIEEAEEYISDLEKSCDKIGVKPFTWRIF